MNQEARLDHLIAYLLDESSHPIDEISTLEDKQRLFRRLCNIREPLPVSDEYLSIQDEYLTNWNGERASVYIKDLEPMQSQLYIWQGDITRLATDGIVNAANSKLLGCTLANHHCIDNIIHTRAGVQLRLDCHDIIQAQGRKEAVGKVKITKAYNLPSSYVLHTVGPFIDERGPSPLKEKLLASCYESTLAIADEYRLSSIAFCCISTGEFNFPNELAAKIAVQTVKDYLQKTKSEIQVVFNVFKDEDLQIYKSLLA